MGWLSPPCTRRRVGGSSALLGAMGVRRRHLTSKRTASLQRAGVSASPALQLRVAASEAHAVHPPIPVLGDMLPPPAVPPTVQFLAAAVGCRGPLGGVEVRDRWSAEPSEEEQRAVQRLREAGDFRVVMASGGTGRSSHLQTALRWLARFQARHPSRILFVPRQSLADIQSSLYNEETLRLFAEFIRQNGSVRPGHSGERVSASAISAYVSAIRAHRSRETGYPITVPHMSLRLAKQAQHMRQEDGPAGARSLVRAFTARFLARLARLPSFDKSSARGRLRWAVLVVGHNLLLRGGEFGVPDGKVFDSARGISVADLDWVQPQHDTDGFEVVVVEVHPAKDAQLSRQRVPLLVRRRVHEDRVARPPALGSCCAWEAARVLWADRLAAVPAHELVTAPFFALADGRPVTTSVVKLFVREAAAAVGEPPEEFDAHSLRVGGATDLYFLFGAGEAEQLIKKRGRWLSDIHQIYSRLSASAEMHDYASMADARGVDMESFRRGYIMPAICHRRGLSR